MDGLPVYISFVFVVTVLLSIYFFYRACNKSIEATLLVFVWTAAQGFIALSGFYTDSNSIPPRLFLAVIPPLLLLAFLFFSRFGKGFIANLNPAYLCLIHTVRIPVELVLFWLFLEKKVPELMTFEGRNFDILSGLTAILIYYFGYKQNKLSRKILLIWNFICLALLANIVIHAVLSAPFPFQQFAFEQPNIAVLYFPFEWLPACVVPIVLFAHLASIKQLLAAK